MGRYRPSAVTTACPRGRGEEGAGRVGCPGGGSPGGGPERALFGGQGPPWGPPPPGAPAGGLRMGPPAARPLRVLPRRTLRGLARCPAALTALLGLRSAVR